MADIREALGKKIGPLPAGAWLVVVGGSIYVARRIIPSDEGEPEVTDEFADDGVAFPAQYRPLTDDYMPPLEGSGAIYQIPPTGGVIFPPGGGDPVVVQPTPLPAPAKDDPPQGVPSFWFHGKRWRANQRGAFAAFIRSRKPLGYRSLNEWIRGVNISGGVQRAPKRFKRGHHRQIARRMGWL